MIKVKLKYNCVYGKIGEIVEIPGEEVKAFWEWLEILGEEIKGIKWKETKEVKNPKIK